MPFNATLPTAFCQNMVWIGREKEIKVRCIYQNHISLGTDRPTDRLDRWLPMPFFNLLVGQRALTPALVATPIYTPSYIPIPMQTRREP